MSRALLKSTSVVSLLTMLSRILGLVRDVTLAAAFGAGPKLDIFFIAQMIPNLGRRMFAEGAFSQAFVPVFTETRTRQTHEQARDLVAVVMGTLGGVLSLITLLGCLAAPLMIWAFAPGFHDDPAQQALGADLLRWTFPYLMFISLTSMVGSILNSYGRFAVPAATPVILNLCIIASAYIGSGSVRVLGYAVFAAGILQFVVQLPFLAQLKLLPRPRWGWGDPRVGRIIRLMVPVMIGSSIAQVSLLLNTSFATLISPGAVSWLNYGSRLMELPIGIFSIAVGTAILPSLSAQHVQKSPQQFSDTLDWGLRTMLLLGLPSALGLILLGGPLVATLFGHGRFALQDVRMTAFVVFAYGFGFMGFSLVKILVPGFYARQETRLPVRYATIGLAFGIATSLLTFAVSRVHRFEGIHVGLAISTSVTAWVNSLLLYRRLRRDGVFRPAPGWGRFALRLLAANAVMAAVVVWLAGDLAGWMAMASLLRALRMAALIVAAMLSYGAMLWLVGLRPHHFRPRRA
ncbi:MAG: murein biosynthesis integral membrane protein MurJ [Nevskia sp.]